VVDAVVAMEGEGPTTGDPVDLGLIIAGEDAATIDLVATALMGWDPMEVGTNFIAAERGLGPRSIDEVELVGLPIDEAARPFKRPQTHSDGQMFIDIRMPIEWYEEKVHGLWHLRQGMPSRRDYNSRHPHNKRRTLHPVLLLHGALPQRSPEGHKARGKRLRIIL